MTVMNSVSYRTLTKHAVKEQLLNNLWTIVGVLAIAPIIGLVQWILGDSVIFEINGFRILDEIAKGTLPAIPVAGAAIGAITAFAAWIISIINAATARTYLGAGMSRGAIFRMNLVVWLASALFMALLATLAMFGHFIATGDFSGDLIVTLPAQIGAAFEAMPGILWFAPAIVFLVMLYAHAAGYFVSIIFVRLPWWIPVGALITVVIAVPLLFGVDDPFLLWWSGSFLKFSDPMASFAAQTVFDTAIFVALSWLALRRLPLRR